jgi:putative nucleotidyltransferase with HDIG domain
MIRAVRFAARLRFEIEEHTLAAIQSLAGRISLISAERVRDELMRILTDRNARRGIELLDQSGLLQNILPEVAAFHGVEQPPEYHPEGDVWTHVMMMLADMHNPSPTLALAVLLHDVGKPPTFRVADRIRFDGHAEVGAAMSQKITERLRLSNDETAQVVALVANHMKFKDVRQMRVSTLKRFLSMPHFEEHLELHRLDCRSSNGYLDTYEFVKEKLAELDEEQLRPAPLISGHDLLRAGYQAGPSFGRALHAVETAQLEGEITTATEALALARTVLDKA